MKYYFRSKDTLVGISFDAINEEEAWKLLGEIFDVTDFVIERDTNIN
jgi:hypothetical protein